MALLALVHAAPEPVCTYGSPGFALGQGVSLTLSPLDPIYPRAIADPRAPQFNILFANAFSSTIDAFGSQRVDIALGGTYGLLRIHPTEHYDVGLQLDGGMGVFSEWDLENSLDGNGWDGVYTLLLTWAASHSFAFKAGLRHLSGHISDEYIENTGRARVEYTREEYQIGVSVAPRPDTRLYADLGYGYGIKDYMAPWRINSGLDWASPRLWHGVVGPFFASNMQLFQEDGWLPSVNLQGGISLPLSAARAYRFGLEYYNGRSMLGEFYMEHEHRIALGWWMEL